MTLVRLVLFAAAMPLLSPIVFAQNPGNCSLDTIKGDYGFVSTVRLLPPANSQVKTVQRSRFIGLISYDGCWKGNDGGRERSAGRQDVPFQHPGDLHRRRPALHGFGDVQERGADDIEVGLRDRIWRQRIADGHPVCRGYRSLLAKEALRSPHAARIDIAAAANGGRLEIYGDGRGWLIVGCLMVAAPGEIIGTLATVGEASRRTSGQRLVRREESFV
jgi:hypothetical protein